MTKQYFPSQDLPFYTLEEFLKDRDNNRLNPQSFCQSYFSSLMHVKEIVPRRHLIAEYDEDGTLTKECRKKAVEAFNDYLNNVREVLDTSVMGFMEYNNYTVDRWPDPASGIAWTDPSGKPAFTFHYFADDFTAFGVEPDTVFRNEYKYRDTLEMENVKEKIDAMEDAIRQEAARTEQYNFFLRFFYHGHLRQLRRERNAYMRSDEYLRIFDANLDRKNTVMLFSRELHELWYEAFRQKGSAEVPLFKAGEVFNVRPVSDRNASH